MPDDALFATAADGTLTQEATISAQVQRMLSDAKARSTIASFHRQWLDLTDLPSQPKDATAFPTFNAQVADAMMQETTLFADYVVRQGDGLLKTLLTSNASFPQGGLFGVYGMTQPAGYQVGTPVMLDPTKRAGILTQAAFLTRWSHNNQTSPVHRGKLIRLNVMCGNVPPPPMNVNTTPPAPTPATSTRQRFAQHSSDPTCAGCHQLMDPIGLGLENFDAIGAYRTMDGLGPVDATGNIVAAGGDLVGTLQRRARAREQAGAVPGRQRTASRASGSGSRWDAWRASTTRARSRASRTLSMRRAATSAICWRESPLSPSFRNVRLTPGG